MLVTSNRTLNSCHNAISEADHYYISETKLLENLKDQNVIELKRIYVFDINEKIQQRMSY